MQLSLVVQLHAVILPRDAGSNTVSAARGVCVLPYPTCSQHTRLRQEVCHVAPLVLDKRLERAHQVFVRPLQPAPELSYRKLVRLGLLVQRMRVQSHPSLVLKRHENELGQHVPDLQLKRVAQAFPSDCTRFNLVQKQYATQCLTISTVGLLEAVFLAVHNQKPQPFALEHLRLRRLLDRVAQKPTRARSSSSSVCDSFSSAVDRCFAASASAFSAFVMFFVLVFLCVAMVLVSFLWSHGASLPSERDGVSRLHATQGLGFVETVHSPSQGLDFCPKSYG
eukprot:2161207-Prymnesium_polylepis.1